MKSALIVAIVITACVAVGGWQDQNTNEFLKKNDNQIFIMPAIQAAVGEAGSGYQMEEIVSVKTQIVAGVNYQYVIKVVDPTHNQTKYFKVVVFSQPWTNTLEVSSCKEVYGVQGTY